MARPTQYRKTVALLLSKKSVPQILTDAAHYVSCMTGNTHFPNPSPTLATVSINIANVNAAYLTSLSGAKGTKGLMYLELKTLEISLKLLAAYVEANANIDTVNAENIIISAGMQVKKPSVRQPKIFSVKAGKIEGDAVLNSKAVKRGAYIYQMTADPKAASGWNEVYQGLHVKCLVAGLTLGQQYYFRVAVIDKNGKGAWSHSLSFIAT
jgi:hypothetical protein